MDDLKPTGCPNVTSDGNSVYSKNLVPGSAVYGERLISVEGTEYRLWDPRRSKMAAYLLLSGKSGGIERNDTVLYLGASTGTTVSHLSDVVDKGRIYAVEISKRTFRELMRNCEPRKNILPMLGDARDEDLMAGILAEADYLYSDVAQRDQLEIFLSNFKRYKCRSGMLMLKCRSIDVTAAPASVAESAVAKIKSKGLLCDSLDIGSYEKDHYAIMVERARR